VLIPPRLHRLPVNEHEHEPEAADRLAGIRSEVRDPGIKLLGANPAGLAADRPELPGGEAWQGPAREVLEG
jgi:hypothetical protein